MKKLKTDSNCILRKLLFPAILAFMLVWPSMQAGAQITKVRGKVTDATTGEPMPFVNVYFKGTTIGATSDLEGFYSIETKIGSDTLVASSVGYGVSGKHIIKGRYQEVNFVLIPNRIDLAEVVIRPGENPAEVILKKVIEKKPENTREKISYYQYEAYNKLQFDANNLSEKFMNRQIMKPFQFIFDYVDTSAINGKTYLPVFLSESLSDVYYRNSPTSSREVIKANRVSGIRDESLSQLMGDKVQQVNIYDNYLTLFFKNFVSPIANFGLISYRYYLVDSANIEGQWCYKLAFKPRRKQEYTFTGNMWIHDSTFAVRSIDMRIVHDANINYINDLVLQQEYRLIDGQYWMLSKEKMVLDFNVMERDSTKSVGFYGTKTTTYRNFVINQPKDNEFYNTPVSVMVDDNATEKTEEFWDTSRHEDLTRREEMVYEMVDTLKTLPVFNTWVDIIQMVATGYYVKGKMEWGPYMSLYSFNQLEGSRIRIGGRTSNDFSTRIMLDGYVAYGFLDQRLKYGGGFMYMADKNPRRVVGGSFKYDVEQLGQSQDAFREDFLLAGLFRRNPSDKLSMVEEYTGYYEHEWFTGFSNTFLMTQRSVWSTGRAPFAMDCEGGDCLTYSDALLTTELTLKTRFAYKESYISGEFERVSLGAKYPILEVNYTYGPPGILGSQFEFHRLQFGVKHWFNIMSLGWSKYSIETGKIWGNLPYPLLKIHPGNESYWFDESAFNLMNYYEFVSDQYFSFYYTHHFVGFFLNKIPLMRKLKWREVAQIKGVVGNVRKDNLEYSAFPDGTYTIGKPYFEAGLGVENIFRFLRVDAVWRLSYLDHPDIAKFGLMVSMRFDF